jgi:hypothetical protein
VTLKTHLQKLKRRQKALITSLLNLQCRTRRPFRSQGAQLAIREALRCAPLRRRDNGSPTHLTIGNRANGRLLQRTSKFSDIFGDLI